MIRRARRFSQIGFFLLFVWLLALTKSTSPSGIGAGSAGHINLFFKFDPLMALVDAAAGHTYSRLLTWSLCILVPTFILGRFFCGWICPMGSLNQILSRIRLGFRWQRSFIASNRYQEWQAAKYFLLIAGMVASLFGCSLIGWIDPFSLLVRSMGLSILPAAASKKYLVVYVPHYWAGMGMGLGFLVLLLANQRVTRFWCRALCPLGALLSAASRWSLLELHKDENACNHCGRCLLDCQGGDDPIGGAPWHKAECHLCLNCVAACPSQSLQFRFFAAESRATGANLTRRKTLSAVGAGLAVAPVLHAERMLRKGRSERLIRPPGALDETEFLARCIRCGECLRACPNDALQPAVTEAGLEGLWSPMLTPSIGYCLPGCVLCSEVCPAGAISELTPQQKGWLVDAGPKVMPVRLGTASYDRAHCLPWAAQTDCVVCLEWCPVSPKAIYTENAVIKDGDGNARTIKRPHVDEGRCVGCGACEYACPILARPAVYVTNRAERRLTQP